MKPSTPISKTTIAIASMLSMISAMAFTSQVTGYYNGLYLQLTSSIHHTEAMLKQMASY